MVPRRRTLDVSGRVLLVAASFLASWVATFGLFGVAAAAQADPVKPLESELGATTPDPAKVDAAVRGVVDAAAADALPVLLRALDRWSELAGKSEMDEARSSAAGDDTTAKGSDAAAAEERKNALKKAQESGTAQRGVVDVVEKAIVALVDAVAAKNQSASVNAVVTAFQEESKRVVELERTDEEEKGKLAKLSSRVFELEAEKDAKDADKSELARIRSDKAEAQAKVDRVVATLERHRRARGRIADLGGKLLREAKGSEVDAALKQLEKRVDGKASTVDRIAWVDLYARVGRDTVPAELVDTAQKSAREAKRHADELEKQRDRYEKAKEAYFKSINYKAGTVDARTQASFEAIQKQIQEISLEQRQMEQLRSATARDVGVAVAVLPAEKRPKCVKELLSSIASEKDLEVRCGLLEGCGALDDATVRESLRKTLVDDKDVKARLAALEGLVGLKDVDAMEVVRTRLLAHENWRVRTAAVSALLRVPQKESIQALIKALEVETGRVKEDVTQALQRLTGQTFAMSALPWQKWWDENQATFDLTKVKPPERRVVAAWDKGEGANGKVTFYGISSASKRMAFVLDVSRSMEEPASDKGNKRKIDVAKEQLKQAITALSDGDKFQIVVFAETAVKYQPKMTVVSNETKKRTLDWIDSKIELGPGTNIHDGMKEAFTIAGLGARDSNYESAIDTIFFLSDGDATVGEVTDAIQIRREIREWNRLSRIRIHCVGVGKDPNIGLLYGIAEDSGGQFQHR